MIRSTISRKYTVYLLLLLALLVGISLGISSRIAAWGNTQLQQDLQKILLDGERNRQQQALQATAGYLQGRLFNPLYNLNIEKLHEEMHQVRAWLPVTEFLLSDPGGRILTDGTPATPRFGEQLPLPDLQGHRPLIRTLPDGMQLVFSIGHGEVLAGYASIRLSNAPLEDILARLAALNRQFSEEFQRVLAQMALGLVAVLLTLGVLLSVLLSRSLARPLIQMSQAAQAFAAGQLEQRLAIHSKDELGELSRALNQLAENLSNSHARLNQAQGIAQLGFWEWTVGDDQQRWSEGIYHILGLDPATVPASVTALLTLIHPDDQEDVRRHFHGKGERFHLECSIHRSGGQQREILIQGEPEQRAAMDNTPVHMVGTLQDISERKHAEQQLSYLANYDALTGLPNRYLLQDRLQHAMHQADRSGEHLAVLFLDVDRFKSINDSLGHSAGDRFLRLLAARLQAQLRSSDTVARLGGDEFTLLLENLPSGDDAGEVATKILQAMTTPFDLGDRELSVSASIGIALYPDDAQDAEMLLQHADTAMYQAKEEGRAGFRFFTRELNRQVQEKLTLQAALSQALGKREFSVYFQPQVGLHDGSIVGVEALMRWHPVATAPVPPGRFIPLLEESDLILRVGEWVLQEACRCLKQWDQAGLQIPRVAVNLSGRQFHQPDLLSSIDNILAHHGLSHRRLELEITESILVEHALGSPIIAGLQQRGVHLAIDDFGTGYSSMSYLKRFAVDTLKIDHSFIDDVLSNEDDAAITSAMISLGHNLHLDVVAEGVESVGQLRFLQHQGCTAIQGYLVSPPLPVGEFLNWLGQLQRTHQGYPRWASLEERKVKPGADA